MASPDTECYDLGCYKQGRRLSLTGVKRPRPGLRNTEATPIT